jgi:hypothetical protein
MLSASIVIKKERRQPFDRRRLVPSTQSVC